MAGMTFVPPEYVKHDYGKLWKHIGISYECKSCAKRFKDEKNCLEHIEETHGKN